MRSMWKGVISFGLVSIPVRLYSATQERDVSFHQVRRSDGARVRYRRVAEPDGAEVAYADIAKGYELPGGEMVVLTDEDFASLPLRTSRAIEVLEFVPLDQVDPLYFAKSYYLEPERQGVRPYVLLRDALAESGRVALAKVALRQREQLATLRVRDDVFVLETMLWPDEVREPDFEFLGEEVKVRPQELAMAGSLIETLATDFDPTRFRDDYREALQAVIDARIEGREVIAPASAPDGSGPSGDLMAALRASIEAAREGRDDGGSAAGAEAGPGARKSTGSRPVKTAAGASAKAPAGRTASGKDTAAKATSSKATSSKAGSVKAGSGRSASTKAPAAPASKTTSRAAKTTVKTTAKVMATAAGEKADDATRRPARRSA